MTSSRTRSPVVFIHGLWLHPTSWQPWLDLFQEEGYTATAPGWPGVPATVEEARANPDSVADRGLGEVTEHYAGIVGALPAPAVVIGHSYGGLIAEKLLCSDLVRAAIAVGASRIRGVLPLPLSQLRSALPVVTSPANIHRAISLTAEQFRYTFGNAVSEQESDRLYELWSIPGPGKPLFEAAEANLPLHSPLKVDTEMSPRGPLLLVAGGEDHATPDDIAKSTFKQYRYSTAVTDLVEFPDRGHSLTIDSGWRAVADECLTWLAKQGL